MTITTNSHPNHDVDAYSSKTVLIGVNDVFFYAKIREALLPHGYHLEKVRSQNEIEHKTSAIHPVAVLLDLNDQIINAIEALKMLKGDPRFSAIPVLAYASHEDVGTWQKARALGVDRIVTRNEMSARARNLVEEILSGTH